MRLCPVSGVGNSQTAETQCSLVCHQLQKLLCFNCSLGLLNLCQPQTCSPLKNKSLWNLSMALDFQKHKEYPQGISRDPEVLLWLQMVPFVEPKSCWNQSALYVEKQLKWPFSPFLFVPKAVSWTVSYKLPAHFNPTGLYVHLVIWKCKPYNANQQTTRQRATLLFRLRKKKHLKPLASILVFCLYKGLNSLTVKKTLSS